MRRCWALLLAAAGLAVTRMLPGAAQPAPDPPAAPAAPKLALLKPAPTSASTYPWLRDYLRVLERFPTYHARHWREQTVGDETLGYFGTGRRDSAETQAYALLAMAYLAAESGFDPRPSGVTQAAVRTQALRSLRHLLLTHTSGSRDRTGGGRWGGDAAAGRVVAPLVAASRLLAGHLPEPDRAAVAQLVQREADRLLEQAPAEGKPGESGAMANATATACLAWAAALLPDHAHAPRWEYQVRLFAVNTLSVPQDHLSELPVDGRPIREWVAGDNLLADYFLQSGGAVSPDAMLRALGSLAEAEYAYASQGRPAPEALTHHFEDAWGAVTRLWLGGRRFARPAGSTETPDAGQAALFPVTALLEWTGSEPSVARRIERDAFQALEAEQMARGDGSFFGGTDPGVEAEAAADLALAALIHRRHGTLTLPTAPQPLRETLTGTWISPAATLAVARSPTCFASWSWRGAGAARAPRGLFGPLDGESLAVGEPDQLVGTFELQGSGPERRLRHHQRLVEGGFTTTGRIEEGRREGQPGLQHFVAFAALPAARVAIAFDLTLAAQDVTVTRNEGLRLRIGGNPLSARRRVLRTEEGEISLPVETDQSLASAWLNVEDRLGLIALYSQQPFTVRRGNPNRRLLGSIDTPSSAEPVNYQTGQIVRDTAILFVAGDSTVTTRLGRDGAVLPTGRELVRAAVLPTPEGGSYLIVANFGLQESTISLHPPGAEPKNDLRLPPLDTLVLALR